MSRPTSRFGKVAAYGDVDASRGEFWVESPWSYPRDKNLSAFEPNRVLLNRGRGRAEFWDISSVSGAGDTGDGRGVLVLDLDDDLAPELVVRHSGGGPLKVFRNAFPRAARLQIELVGSKSNRRGLGGLVSIEFGGSGESGGRRLARQLWANNNFVAQQGALVRFGLGDPAKIKTIDKLVVHWPSGKITELADIAVNQHLRIHEKDGRAEKVR